MEVHLMQIGLTGTRIAVGAAALVLIGVGVATVLTPLVETATATAGQVVNVSDPTLPYTAKVTSAGELKTNGVVSGKVAPALPPSPFSVLRPVATSAIQPVLGPTTATVALTDLAFANSDLNLSARVSFYQYSAAAPNTACTSPRARNVTAYYAPSAQTVVQDFITPIVLKPLATGDAWCLMADAAAPVGGVQDFVTLGGYVLAGTFTP
jgi:hypothetical protein